MAQHRLQKKGLKHYHTMSKPLTTAGTAALGKNPYNRLVAETEHLLHRQRKKGPEYKVIVDSKKKKEEEEYLQKLLYGDVEEESPGTNSPTKNVASPRKEGTAKGGVSMDAYDPKEVAARELEALTDEVRLLLPPYFFYADNENFLT